MDAEGVGDELIRGVVCEIMSAGVNHVEIVTRLEREIRHPIRPQQLGRIKRPDRDVLLEYDPDTVRECDTWTSIAGACRLGPNRLRMLRP